MDRIGDGEVVELHPRRGQPDAGGNGGGQDPPGEWKIKRWMVMAIFIIDVIALAPLAVMEVRGMALLSSFDDAHVVVPINEYRGLAYRATLTDEYEQGLRDAHREGIDKVFEIASLKHQIETFGWSSGSVDPINDFGNGYRAAMERVARYLALNRNFMDQLYHSADMTHGDNHYADLIRGEVGSIAGAFGCSCHCFDLINLTLKNADFGQVLGFLSQKMGVPILNEAGVAGRITIKLTEIPAQYALSVVVDQFEGVALQFRNGVFRVVYAEEQDRRP